MTLALVSSGQKRGSQAQTPIFTIENLHLLVQMTQARPGPSHETWKSVNLEIQKLGIQQISKMKILKIRIHVAQNVGKVWIGRKNTFLALFGGIPGNVLHGHKKIQKNNKTCLFSLVGQWALFTRFWIPRCLAFRFLDSLSII